MKSIVKTKEKERNCQYRYAKLLKSAKGVRGVERNKEGEWLKS